METDKIKLRPAQQRMFEAVELKVEELKRIIAQGRKPTPEEKTVVCWLDPGTGKTPGHLHCTNWLSRTGFIDSCAIYTPRFNLCQQAELDWNNDFRELYVEPRMGKIIHRGNEPPLLRDQGDFGFVSTYQSLVADPDIHRKFVAAHRPVLVLDEAQMLGWDSSEYGTGTKSASYVLELAEHASIILLLTGTPYRQDRNKLILARYSEPDEYNRIHLIGAVRAGYTEGVKEGYLRPFDAQLVDGRALYEYLDGDSEELIVSNLKSGFYKVIEEPGYWQPIVDMTLSEVKQFQTIDPRYCGLIACNKQPHAKAIMKYIEGRYPHVKALVATSDMSIAQDNLRLFKSGKYDILITVAMAHVGYDHKPITVVCCLGSIRDEGWLRQLFARGMRMMLKDGKPELEGQHIKVIAPDDPKMVSLIIKLRQESDEGIRLWEEGKDPPPPNQERLGQTIEAGITDIEVKGTEAKHDVSYKQYPELKALIDKHELGPVSLTGFKAALDDYYQDHSLAPKQSEPPSPLPPPDSHKLQMTRQEWEVKVRAAIKGICSSGNGALLYARIIDKHEAKNYCQNIMYQKFGTTTNKGMDELTEMLKYANNDLAVWVEDKTGCKVRRITL